MGDNVLCKRKQANFKHFNDNENGEVTDGVLWKFYAHQPIKVSHVLPVFAVISWDTSPLTAVTTQPVPWLPWYHFQALPFLLMFIIPPADV